MSSLKERIEWLERELPPNPPRFRIHEDLPFAILRYDPKEEWELRRESGCWQPGLERDRGFAAAHGLDSLVLVDSLPEQLGKR
jgi:hypothetical protein